VGLSLRAVAADREATFVALAGADDSIVEARRGAKLSWSAKLGGNAAAMTRAGGVVAVAVSGRGHIFLDGLPSDAREAAFSMALGDGYAEVGNVFDAGGIDTNGRPMATAAAAPASMDTAPTIRALTLRGDPGAILIALDAATGKRRWQVPIDGSEWSQITSVAASGDDIIVGGSFGGTLRIGDRVVASAGGSDGFVARVHDGTPVWLVRVGGAGADAVQGVAATKDRVAIAGTFTGSADVLGQAFDAFDERLPYADAFVADLDAANGTHRWHASFGGRGDESIAGVTIDARGNIVVAGSAREVVKVGSQQLTTQGASDGIVVWYTADGGLGSSVLVGGLDFDGLRGITAVGDRVVVGGFFSGTLPLDQAIKADGGDDAFFAALDENGTVVRSWHVGGAGREDIASVASAPGGFIAGVQYSATAKVDDEALAAPADPLSGAAIVVRGL
jgi:hypothetical protein